MTKPNPEETIDNDLLQLADDDEAALAATQVEAPALASSEESWKILIVDDDPEVHDITRLVLGRRVFENRPLAFLSAYSGAEGAQMMREHPDTALILLDVVMEHEHSGLDLVRHIRGELNNHLARIILRTGQPGQAPETKVVMEYDINDYKEKSELSSQQLLTTVIASLRSFQALQTIVRLNEELEQKVLDRTADLQKANLSLAKSLKMIELDEEAGRKIQFKMLPDAHKRIAAYHFSRYLSPSLYVSGDFLDYFEVDDDHIAFYMADVSGHGVSSAFVTMLLKSFFTNRMREYKAESDDTILDPARLLSALNAEILQEDLGKHLTLFYAVIQKSENHMVFANAGQFPLPLLRTDGATDTIPCKGPPVGMFDFSAYANIERRLPDAFSLVIWSDGILEILPQENIDSQMAHLASLMDREGFDMEYLIEQTDVRRKESLPDDVTILLIRKDKGDGGE